MANYVLAHGGNMCTDTWNRLAQRNDYPAGGHLGGRIWDGIVSALAARHHLVFAPTLKDEKVTTLTGDIEQICRLINENSLNRVILVRCGNPRAQHVVRGLWLSR